jgi:hypothetical protein
MQTELKEAIQIKINEFDAAKEMNKSNEELLRIYKELKELQYQKVLAEVSIEVKG